jgi:hypothetical protein
MKKARRTVTEEGRFGRRVSNNFLLLLSCFPAFLFQILPGLLPEEETGVCHGQSKGRGRRRGMLWTIVFILLVLWLVGWLGFHLLGAAIHILVALAVIFAIVALIRRA